MTRANPKRSGGPKSESGKLVAASNALKTGAYSMSTIILPGESEAEFNELVEQFSRDFAPSDIAEVTMVRDLAILAWKKRRLDRIEHSGMMRAINAPFDAYDFVDSKYLSQNSAQTIREMGDDAREFQRTLIRAKELLKGVISPELIPVLQKDFPLLYREIETIAQTEFDEEVAREIWGEFVVDLEDGEDGIPFLNFAIQEFISNLDDCQWPLENLELARAEISSVLEKRLMRFMDQRVKFRVSDDLDRAFYRTLNELRKHQGWRRATSEITVNAEPKMVEANGVSD